MAESPWNQTPAAVPPPPASPPAPLRIGVRTAAELQQLADDAAAPEPRVVMFCSLDDVALEGIIATARWLLGQRNTSPISREIDDFPRTEEALGREAARADDAIWGRGPYTDLHEDYAAAVRHTLWWVRGLPNTQRPVAERRA
ncbi:hypothetical protein [Streptomyces sp. NPDC053560]|uniref:hypothetical protein n=1 Tax=Streptomyces sp. NPDC053560 TaxID=3365711 RepID=UPI0037CF74DA